ncbi:MAG: winged helix-turn-helix transcriptional regulator [Clostridiales bacterium]|nr:winged helix-turn-helix transcriptional regulator [Clostridiales bacterium]
MENKRLFGKICYLQRQMYREINRELAEQGITPVKLQTLIYLIKNERVKNEVCQRDIERELNLRPSSVSALLKSLEREGYLIRTFRDGDARTKYLELTEKGRKLCKDNKLFMEKCDETVQSALSDNEQDELQKLLEKIIAKISE